MVERTGWTWDYLRGMQMPQFWRILRAMTATTSGGSRDEVGGSSGPGMREVRRASFGG